MEREERDPGGTGPDSLGYRWLIVGLASVGPFSLNIFKPCLPWIKADFAVDITIVQLGLSLSILASAVATVWGGVAGDIFGRRPVILLGAYLYVLSSLMAALAPNVEVLIAARVVQAASSSVELAAIRAVVYDSHSQAQKVIARITLMSVAAVLLAPVIGGLLIDTIGWRAVFGLTALLGLGLLAPAHLSLSETVGFTGKKSRPSRVRENVVRLLRSPAFHGYAFQSSLHFAIFFAYTSAAAYLMVDLMGRPAAEYGVWFVVLAFFVMSGLGIAEKLSTRVRTGRMACLGSALVMIGCLVSGGILLWVELTPHLLFLPAAIAGVGVGISLPGSNAGVMDVVPEVASTASGLLAFLWFLAAAAFAQIVVQDEPNTPAVLAILMIAGGVVSFAFSLLSANHGSTGDPVKEPDLGG